MDHEEEHVDASVTFYATFFPIVSVRFRVSGLGQVSLDVLHDYAVTQRDRLREAWEGLIDSINKAGSAELAYSTDPASWLAQVRAVILVDDHAYPRGYDPLRLRPDISSLHPQSLESN